MEGSSEPRGLNRRELLTGVAAAAAGAMLPAEEGEAGIMQDALAAIGIEGPKREELEDKFHAAEVYMNYNGGALRENFNELKKVAANIRSGAYEDMRADERSAYIDSVTKPITDEKNALLAAYDKELIPELLAQYVKYDLKNKSLVEVYLSLGGDIAKVKAEGVQGVDAELVNRIQSYMRYDLNTLRGADYGNAMYEPLSFEKKKPVK